MDDIVITGLGVVSPLGCAVESMCGRAAAGDGINDEHPDGLVCDIPIDVIPADKRSRIGRLDRLCRLFLSASYLAAGEARLELAGAGAERVGLSFGTGLGCLLTNAEYYDKIVEQGPAAASPRLFAYTVSSAAAGEVSIALGIKGPNVTQHLGLAAGLGALGYGFDLLEMGKADVMLAGGADANGPVIAEALRDMGLSKGGLASRPFRDAVPGVWPAEGATVAVLERAASAAQRGAPVWGRIAGYAAGFEPSLAGRMPQAQGVIETMRRALDHSGLSARDVDVVVASAHGTPADAAERAAQCEVFGDGAGPLVLAPKAVLGDAFGASGVLGLALAAGFLRAPPDEIRGLAFAPDGSALNAGEAAQRLRRASVVMVNALCYSGNLVSLLFTRHDSL